MDQHRLVRPGIVPDAGLAPARKAKCLDAGQPQLADLEIAILGGKCNR